MSFRRGLTSTLLALAVSIGGSTLAAQVSNRGTSLLVPVSGVADLGGMFEGALLIERFAPQADGLAAVGTVTGALVANGTVRNLVMQVALPLDIAASRARLNTDAALAQSSCSVLHVELGSASMNVLGTNFVLNPVAFDIASTLPSGNAAAPVNSVNGAPAPVSPTTSTAQASAAQRGAATTQPGTVTPSPSPNTTQPAPVTPSMPGPASNAPQQTAPQTSLGSLLCSVDRFRDVSNPARLAQQLNAIVTALGTTEGS